MKIKLIIEYDGSQYSGWQAQEGQRTIQGELERVVSDVVHEKITLYASGRTDAGVNARAQVAHFEIGENFKFNRFQFLGSVNFFLPDDIIVKDACVVGDDFDARFTVKKKTYRYYFYVSRFERPLFAKFLRVNDNVSVDLMREACQYLIGEHDFKSFVARKSGKTNFVRTIYDAKILDFGDDLFAFEITGSGFLYNMVRIIMGTLIKIGTKKCAPNAMKEIIDGKSRASAGKTVSGTPLVLFSVDYGE
ncbi:MAG: tRNA pseudouridine(38-40) synthase TruA [Clostridia bacterium]|nr:tRNA pseudouridine(38-40) synthase TruA [Clostridia bacterium]